MISKYGRIRREKQRTGIAIVAGIFVILCGLYFIFGISRQTDEKNAKCTEETTGIVSDVKASGKKYLTTIDYEIEDIEKTMTVETKKDLGVGAEIVIKYEPLYFSHLYIEGISPTGKNDQITGAIMLLAGGVLVVGGFLLKSRKPPAVTEEQM